MSNTTSSYTQKNIKLTPVERSALSRICNDRLNWSDGGHWIGFGPKPNCFKSDSLSNKISHTWKFPTDTAALKWNEEQEKQIRFVGHGVTTGLTVAIGLVFGGWPGIAVAIIAGVAKDEVQAKVPYPKMARGWSFEVIFEHGFKWSPHPWGQNYFKQQTITIIRNHLGEIQSTSVSTSKYQLDELPEGLARSLSSVPSKTTSSIYE
ncbi:MAG: hypothetical protein ACRBCS_08280 [Cellvibrionaceae bacterium]